MPIVKICGITNTEDALHAIACGADLLGFIQYPPSTRYVSPVAAGNIIEKLPAGVRTVGVFVNESSATLRESVDTAGFDVIQLHGDEEPEILADLKGYEVIKAISLRVAPDLSKANEWPTLSLLVDTPCPEYGGSGELGDWALAAQLAQGRRIILAGGLNPDNVAEAIRVVKPYGVDVSTGVEKSKGFKDPEKVESFLANARAMEVAP